MNHKSFLTFFLIFLFPFFIFKSVFATDYVISGKLLSIETGKPVEYANILLTTGEGTYSGETGDFQVKSEKLPVKVTISHIAFRDTSFIVYNSSIGNIYLRAEVIAGEEVFVTATRAVKGKSPVAFSTLSNEEIKARYTVEDVPMILAMEPGVYSYSESGNGTGYSYIQIRGFDQSRIAVMMNNVPLNDNESHQVYWVDHGDVLSDAEDVQIQRGIGNSLYGTSAFGGSVNVITSIGSDKPELSLNVGAGSYNTSKIHLKATSGALFDKRVKMSARLSQIKSEGYRDFHDTVQKSGAFGVEYDGKNFTHQFRALVGYENSHLMWDGVSADNIDDREKRRAGYQSYLDDFLQQVYSLNSSWRISDRLHFCNVAYLVKGSGYYEVFKEGCDIYSYNLDVNDQYSDSLEMEMKTDLLRRKWIVNNYFGIIPTLTYIRDKYRLDIGGEIRSYTGDHFGEIADFSDPDLSSLISEDWYQYYNYIGEKLITTGFAHFAFEPLKKLKLIADLQYQYIHWNMDQKKIGHAVGYQLDAKWNFLNPRLGAIYSFSDELFVFANYGKAQREPADDQIIEADDVWNAPQKASAELIHDYELGGRYRIRQLEIDLNLYRINYKNEQLKNIDIEQEGEYDYYQAGKTLHQGLEIEFGYQASKYWSLNLNSSIGEHIFSTGDLKGNTIPNVPCVLFNGSLTVKPVNHLSVFLTSRYVGKQTIDNENIGANPDYWLYDGGFRISFRHLELSVKVNNIFDTLYSTFGYGYEWDGYWAYYWPGATRNVFVSVSVKL
ncbi:TonB-dependent receptor [bacterium]|nr:TonB-dependent receptor [bacterium]